MRPRFGIRVARIRYRLTQGFSYLRPRNPTRIDERLRQLLRPEELRLIECLSVADRAHHLNVRDCLVRHGCGDEELLTAALLHDVGKADADARVGLVGRTLSVLLEGASPGLTRRFASTSGGGLRRALDLSARHPQRGAEMARAAGCSDRVCWIIAHHHDKDAMDDSVKLLQRADDGEL